jgi:hypothetical protein
MTARQPRYSKEEAARLGDEIYDRDVRAQVEPQHNGKIVALDLDTGAWEMDADEAVAAKRLEARHPDAQIWVVRVGSRYVRRFGAGRVRAATV